MVRILRALLPKAHVNHNVTGDVELIGFGGNRPIWKSESDAF